MPGRHRAVDTQDVLNMNLISARDEALEKATDPDTTEEERRDNAVRAETFHRVLEWRTWVWAAIVGAGGWLISRLFRSSASAVAATVAATGAASTAAVVIIAAPATIDSGHTPAGAVETKTVTVSATSDDPFTPHSLNAVAPRPAATRSVPATTPSPTSVPTSTAPRTRVTVPPPATTAEESIAHANPVNTAPAAATGAAAPSTAAVPDATTLPPTTTPPSDTSPPARQQDPTPPPVESPPAGGGPGSTTSPGRLPILPGLGGLVPSLLPGHQLLSSLGISLRGHRP